ncbi:MAG: pitrilysin family protein [bacterium]
MIRSGRLPNGMRVLTESIPHAISVSVGLWALRGARNEPPEGSGITHFVEHLLFKGTETRSALDISREIESVGGALNAFTGKEFVCVHAKVLDTHLPLAIELVSDIFLRAVIPEDEVERERQVILQEIRTIEDSPEELVHELFLNAYWRGHALGRSTLGTAETIGRVDREGLLSYASLLRDPDQVLLSVAGNLDSDAVMELAGKFFDFPRRSPGDLTTEKPTPHRGLHLHLKDLEQAHICLGTLGYNYSHPQRYAYHVLNTLLGGGTSSRLFQEVRERRGLAYSVYSFQASYYDAGLLGVYVGTSREAVIEVVKLLMENLSLLKNESVSTAELRTAKEQLKGNLLLSTESTGSRMSKLAMNEIYFGRQLDIHDVIREIENVTEEDVRRTAVDLFRQEYLNLSVLGDVDRDALTGIDLNL